MATFRSLTETETNTHHKTIFGILAEHETQYTSDGTQELCLDAEELTAIRDEQYQIVKDNLSMQGQYQSAKEMKNSLMLHTQDKINAYVSRLKSDISLEKNKGIVNDGYFNSVSGIGTMIDPAMSTQSFIPVSITPTEATSYYSSGGVPARIIDKKAGCLSLQGIKFICADFKADDLQKLEDYADKCGFTQAYRDAITQALIFGGSCVYPMLKGDSPLTTQYSKSELLAMLPEKDFIKYWITADRWNVVFVPDYNITAQDYLYARTVFIPLGGCRVNTQRCAMIRPRKLPFWGAIANMGWSTSDFEGWIKDYESYEIMKMSLPIMAQQMSLMYHSFPADGMIIENGTEYARQFFKQNEEELRNWSMLHPKAINSIGEIKILERSYSGFQQLITEARLALCASSSVPESILFAQKSTGLASDNKDDIELKQSEAIRLLFNNVAPSFQNCIEMMVYSCFGKNSEQAKYAKNVQIAPDDGVILSDMDRATLGQGFSTIAGQLVSIGVPLSSSVQIAKSFIPSAELSEQIMAEISGGDEKEAEGLNTTLWEKINELSGGKNAD